MIILADRDDRFIGWDVLEPSCKFDGGINWKEHLWKVTGVGYRNYFQLPTHRFGRRSIFVCIFAGSPVFCDEKKEKKKKERNDRSRAGGPDRRERQRKNEFRVENWPSLRCNSFSFREQVFSFCNNVRDAVKSRPYLKLRAPSKFPF